MTIQYSSVYSNLSGDSVDFSIFIDGKPMNPDDSISPNAYVSPVWGLTPKGNDTVVGLDISAAGENFTIDAKLVRKLKLQHLCCAFKRAQQLMCQDEDTRECDPDSYMEGQDYQGLAEHVVAKLAQIAAEDEGAV